MLTLHTFNGPFLTIEMTPDFFLTAETRARTDAVWEDCAARRPSLFDGPILTVIDYTEGRMIVARASYRHLIASRTDADLKLAIGLRPLAVSGILSSPDGLVFGKRAKTLTQGAGLWELAPSGGVEPPPEGASVDLIAAILNELRDEVGLTPSQVTAHSPMGMVEDRKSGVIDVVIPLTTPLTADAIRAAHASQEEREYEALHITTQALAFARNRDDLLDVSRAILNAFFNLNASCLQ